MKSLISSLPPQVSQFSVFDSSPPTSTGSRAGASVSLTLSLQVGHGPPSGNSQPTEGVHKGWSGNLVPIKRQPHREKAVAEGRQRSTGKDPTAKATCACSLGSVHTAWGVQLHSLGPRAHSLGSRAHSLGSRAHSLGSGARSLQLEAVFLTTDTCNGGEAKGIIMINDPHLSEPEPTLGGHSPWCNTR